MGHITEGIADAVISIDSHSTRFEDFCNGVVSHLEGGAVVTATSRSWDLGRDGKGHVGRARIFTCCSLDDNVNAKATADIKRLISSTPNVDRVYFCSNQPLSEKRVSEIEAQLLTIVPSRVQVVVLGRIQLTDIALKKPDLINRHYKAEIEDCLAALSGEDTDDGAETQALRLALCTAGHGHSSLIRQELYQACLRTILSDGNSRNLAEICRDISNLLRLSRVLPEEAIGKQLEDLRQIGEVDLVDSRYSLTDKGRAAIRTGDISAAATLMSGRQQVREAIETGLGEKLSDEHYSRMWRVFQEKVAHHTRGQQMVASVSAMLEGGPSQGIAEVNARPFFVNDLASAVAATASLPEQRANIQMALTDLFSDRSGPAFEWLVGLCTTFVALCSLGLESTSGRAISRMLSKIVLVFDSDVVYSLLSPGEPDHIAAKAIVKRWRKLGGRILMAEPVLHEAAYHAWISEVDYNQVRRWLPGTEVDRQRLIENAFVRGFAHLVARGEARLRDWPSYIRQFRGTDARDFAKIAGYLVQEYGMDELPRCGREEAKVEADVAGYLIRQVESRSHGGRLRIAKDKARRDASLYAALLSYLRNLRRRDPGGSCLLVSSARRLVDIEAKFAKAGETHLVVPISTIIYILSLVPEVSFGLSAMQTLLFDEKPVRFSSDLERTLLRVLRESQEVAIPWAKRGTLMRHMRDRLMDDARQSGKASASGASTKDFERDAMRPGNLGRTAEILRESLDAVAIDTKTERQNVELRRTIAELKKEISRLSGRPPR